MRIAYYKNESLPEFQETEPVKISFAKKMLKKHGGYAWIEHYDRDGSLFDTTDIKIEGKNLHKKPYNIHL